MDDDALTYLLLVLFIVVFVVALMLGYAAGVSSMQDKLDACADGWYQTMGALHYALEAMP